MKGSVYKNFKNKIEDKNIIDVLYEIKSNLYEKEIISLRIAIKKSDFTLAEKLKKALIAFTPSATFFHSRTIGEINKLSSIVCIDMTIYLLMKNYFFVLSMKIVSKRFI